MNFITRWLVLAVAIAFTAWILPGMHLEGLGSVIVASLILALINVFLKPVLIILTLPVTIVTLGIFLLIINALLLLLAAKIAPGFQIDTFWWAVLGSIIISLISGLLSGLGRKDRVVVHRE